MGKCGAREGGGRKARTAKWYQLDSFGRKRRGPQKTARGPGEKSWNEFQRSDWAA